MFLQSLLRIAYFDDWHSFNLHCLLPAWQCNHKANKNIYGAKHYQRMPQHEVLVKIDKKRHLHQQRANKKQCQS